jgi:Mn2+/Fe2+ NRAMP family transporter
MADSIRIIFPQIPFVIATFSFATVIVLLEILIPYNKYVKILKYLSLSLYAYIATAIIVGGNWNQILVASLFPHIEPTSSFIMMFGAMFGATISPYLFFWQASGEDEESVAKHKIKEIGNGRPKVTKKEIKLMRADTIIGIGFSQFVAWTIIITPVGTLHAKGIIDIQTADQAAKALEPLVNGFSNAGLISKAIFALGIIGIGFMAIPVLAGSSAYAISDVFGLK